MLTFQNSFLDLDGTGGDQHIALGDIGPGSFGAPASVQFPDTVTFTSAIFTARISDLVLQLSGGGTFTAASETATATMLPSAGGTLVAGTDFAVISTSDSGTAGVPQPATGVAVLVGSLSLFAATRRNRPTKR